MPQKSSYHHGSLRNALVDAAMRLIGDDGHEAFSLREAARTVGVTANAAYRHFEDKSALVTAVAQHGFQALGQQMIEAMQAAGGRGAKNRAVARFQACGRAYVAFALQNPELFAAMFGPDGLTCFQSKAARADAVLSPFELLGKALDALVAAGALTPKRRVGAELKAWAVVHGFARLILDGAGGRIPSSGRLKALESVLEFAVDGLCAG
jgi:AcrR family transcriptional regulator